MDKIKETLSRIVEAIKRRPWIVFVILGIVALVVYLAIKGRNPNQETSGLSLSNNSASDLPDDPGFLVEGLTGETLTDPALLPFVSGDLFPTYAPGYSEDGGIYNPPFDPNSSGDGGWFLSVPSIEILESSVKGLEQTPGSIVKTSVNPVQDNIGKEGLTGVVTPRVPVTPRPYGPPPPIVRREENPVAPKENKATKEN